MHAKILITGACGYLGSVLSLTLAKMGCTVLALDIRPSAFGSLENIQMIQGDCADETILKKHLPQADILIPLAALVGAPVCEQYPELAKRVNFNSVRIMNRLRSKNQQIIFPMTNNGYRASAGESAVTEKSNFLNDSLYTLTKFQAEEEVLGSGNAVSLRLASLFGPSPAVRWDLLLHFFVKQAWSEKKIHLYEGHFKRSFIHIQDAADGFMFALENFERLKNNIYNLALESGNISKLELAEKIKKQLPDTLIEPDEKGKDPDARDVFVSTEKLKKAGFEAKRSIDDGIAEMLHLLGKS